MVVCRESWAIVEMKVAIMLCLAGADICKMTAVLMQFLDIYITHFSNVLHVSIT